LVRAAPFFCVSHSGALRAMAQKHKGISNKEERQQGAVGALRKI
jgi:hypothetical protein